jgi:hypothetical protein
MRVSFKRFLVLLTAAACVNTAAVAGNEDRSGQAGASELLINPWSRSSGFAGANMATVRGLESQFLNVAGTAFTKKTEVLFSHTQWLKGSEVNINSFGFTQRVGESGVIGVGVMSMDFGKIAITTTDLPEGGIGTFNPSFVNIGLSYAKEFSSSIYGGLTVKAVNEAIADVKAQGVALDAGIQYIAGKHKNIKFGVALKNIGPPLKYSGNGLNQSATLPQQNNKGGNTTLTLSQRNSPFELPSQLNIGGALDLFTSKDTAVKTVHRVTIAANFTSNSFSKDSYQGGVEYGFKTYFMVRGGYYYEKGIIKDAERTTALTGPTAGFTFEIPLNSRGTSFGVDYAYRWTNPFQGCHSIGARINL